MSTLTKISVVILLLLILLACPVFITMATVQPHYKDLLDHEVMRTRLLSQDNRQVNVALQRAQFEINQSKARADAAESKLISVTTTLTAEKDQLGARNVQLGGQLENMGGTLKQMAEQMDAKEERNVELSKMLEAQRKANRELDESNRRYQEQLNQAELKAERTEKQLTFLTDDVHDKEKRIRDLEEQLRGKGAIVTGAKASPSGDAGIEAPRITGTLTAVSDDLASINIGSSKGVKVGMTMMIYRGGDYVANLLIDRVDSNAAAGTIVKGRLKPMIGDKVENIESQR